MKIFISSLFFVLLSIVIIAATSTVFAQDDETTKQAKSSTKMKINGNTIDKEKDLVYKKTMKRPQRRSLFAACRSEIANLECITKQSKMKDGTAAGRREMMTLTIDCLEQKIDKMAQKSTCKSWLDARRTCQADTKSADSVCPTAKKNTEEETSSYLDETTMCLLHADITKLSRDCRESEYFRALSFQRMWRMRRDRNVRMNNKPNILKQGGNQPAVPAEPQPQDDQQQQQQQQEAAVVPPPPPPQAPPVEKEEKKEEAAEEKKKEPAAEAAAPVEKEEKQKEPADPAEK